MPRHRIDIHHHFLPQRYMHEEHERIPNVVHNIGDRLLKWTPAQAIEVMDQNGIAVAIGSVSTPGPWFGDVAAARRLSRDWNEAGAGAQRPHPRRVRIFPTIAPPPPHRAL